MGIVIDARAKFEERRKQADLKRGKGKPIPSPMTQRETAKSVSEQRTERLRKALEDMKKKDTE